MYGMSYCSTLRAVNKLATDHYHADVMQELKEPDKEVCRP
jgi:hypothetical protein